jgi:hypothetical protein
VVERWPAAVGEAIARSAWPVRIGRGGRLHVATADAVWAFELAQRAGEIAQRLGVPEVRFAPGPLPSVPATPLALRAAPPSAADARRAAEIAAGIEAENLREIVQKAVSLSLARRGADRSV